MPKKLSNKSTESNKLSDTLTEALNELTSVSESADVTGYFSVVTFLDKNKEPNGSYFIYDALDIVHLIGFVEILLTEIKSRCLVTKRQGQDVDSSIDRSFDSDQGFGLQ